jgi:hypothetical protein
LLHQTFGQDKQVQTVLLVLLVLQEIQVQVELLAQVPLPAVLVKLHQILGRDQQGNQEMQVMRQPHQ